MAPLIGHGKTSSLSSQDPLRPRTRRRVDSRVYMRKAPASFDAEAFFLKNGGYLLSHGCAVPSARAGLTSLFGMGRGGTPPL